MSSMLKDCIVPHVLIVPEWRLNFCSKMLKCVARWHAHIRDYSNDGVFFTLVSSVHCCGQKKTVTLERRKPCITLKQWNPSHPAQFHQTSDFLVTLMLWVTKNKLKHLISPSALSHKRSSNHWTIQQFYGQAVSFLRALNCPSARPQNVTNHLLIQYRDVWPELLYVNCDFTSGHRYSAVTIHCKPARSVLRLFELSSAGAELHWIKGDTNDSAELKQSRLLLQ